MLAASRLLFLQRGYAGTTTEVVAEEAGVSPRTVLAAFGSKRGILAELLSLNSFGERYQELLVQLRVETQSLSESQARGPTDPANL